MKNKFKKVAIFFVVLVIVLVLNAIILKNAISYEPTIDAYVYTEDVAEGTMLTDENIDKLFTIKTFNAFNVPKTALKDLDSINGLYVLAGASGGYLVNTDMLVSENPLLKEYALEEGYSTFSLKFDDVESANAWIVEVGDTVTLLYTPRTQSNSTEIDEGNAYAEEMEFIVDIIEIKDATLYTDDDGEFNTASVLYITFKAPTEDAKFISRAKFEGYIDIISSF